MDDDIRDRFRGVSRGARSSTPSYRGTPSAPPPKSTPKPEPPKPKKPKKAKKSRTKLSRKTKLIVLGVVLLLAVGGAVYALKKNDAADQNFEQEMQSAPETVEEKPSGTIRFVAVGDSLAFDSINSAAKQPDGIYNYAPMMSNFQPFFEKSDISLCNQVTPGGGGADITGYPSFNAPVAWSSGFADVGCNLMNLASDHMNDKGQSAIDVTRDTWNETKDILGVAGANRTAEEQAKIEYFTIKGLKFAYLAYTTNSLNKTLTPYGVNQYSDDLATTQITEARKNAKFVIVSMHWGAEDQVDVNADQDRIAQYLASQNVDVIVGAGPRVVQPVKLLDGTEDHQTLVWFSLGNFLGSQTPINNLIGGMAVMDIDAATRKIKSPKLVPVYMHYEWTAAQKSARNLASRREFKLYPLDVAAEPLARSQNNTTVEAQTARITDIVNKFTPVIIIKSTEL